MDIRSSISKNKNITMKYFFHSIRQTCLFSSDFYNKIILKRKDLTVNSRINDCAISVD
nr:MAG TPA: hypothetical protein [Caudoviricetes sp.]